MPSGLIGHRSGLEHRANALTRPHKIDVKLPSRLREGLGVGLTMLAAAGKPTPNPSRKREGDLSRPANPKVSIHWRIVTQLIKNKDRLIRNGDTNGFIFDLFSSSIVGLFKTNRLFIRNFANMVSYRHDLIPK